MTAFLISTEDKRLRRHRVPIEMNYPDGVKAQRILVIADVPNGSPAGAGCEKRDTTQTTREGREEKYCKTIYVSGPYNRQSGCSSCEFHIDRLRSFLIHSQNHSSGFWPSKGSYALRKWPLYSDSRSRHLRSFAGNTGSLRAQLASRETPSG